MKAYIKKSLAFGLAVLTAGALLTGCDGGEKKQAAGPVPVKVGWSPSACGAPVFIAYEKGFFKEEGLAPEMIQVDAAHIAEAVGAGQVDIFNGLIGKLIKPLENGLAAQEVTGLHKGCIKILVPNDSDIKTIADLKGKKIGVPGLADAGTIIAKRALHGVGVDVTDKSTEVEFTVFGRNDLPQALDMKKVDAIAFGDPQATIAAEKFGFRVLLDTSKDKPFGDEYCCALFMASKLVKGDPETAKKVTRAVQRASQWVHDHPEEAANIEIEKKYVAGDVKLVAALLKSYDYSPSVQGGYDAMLNTVKSLSEIGLTKGKVDAKKFTDSHTAFFKDFPDKPEKK